MSFDALLTDIYNSIGYGKTVRVFYSAAIFASPWEKLWGKRRQSEISFPQNRAG